MNAENMIKVPLIQPTMPTLDEYMTEIASIWDTRQLTNMAPKHQQLEQELKAYLEVNQLQLFGNGHQALECSFQALGLTGEVITTPFTFVSTIHAIVRCGLKPVFCDIRPDDFTLDVSKIEGLITERTTAIVPVHVYGTACDVEAIGQLAGQYGLKVIYDAAHALGITVGGRGIGTFGDVSMFSFHATKVYNTVEGGALTFADPALAKRLAVMKNFGITGGESVEYVAGNGKLDEFRAAMGLCNLRHLEEAIRQREAVVRHYDQRLSGVNGIQVLPAKTGQTKNYSYYPILMKGGSQIRDAMAEKLMAKGIVTRKYFYPLCCDYECYRREYGGADVPTGRAVAEKVLCLPLFAGMTTAQVDWVCDAILA